MDLSLAVALTALGGAVLGAVLAVLAVLATRRPAPVSAPATDLGPALEVLRRGIEETRTANASLIGELRGDVQRSLGATEQQLTTQTTATQRTLTDLSRQLGALGEQSVRVADL